MSTLTANPAAGTGGTTYDGECAEVANGLSYASAHNAGGNSLNGTNSTGKICANSFLGAGPQFTISRGAFMFDTSSLGGNATISSAVISFFGTGSVNNGDTDSVSIVGYTGGSSGDYTAFGSTKFATDLLFSSWSTSGYNDFTLNASGISNINKTGVSSFGVRTAKDLSSTQPAAQNDVSCVFADNGSNKPKLVVTYTLPTQTLSVTAVFVPSISRVATHLRTLTQSATAVVSLSKTFIKVISLSATATAIVSIAKTITYLFTKVARPSGTSTPVARPTATYSKVATPTSSWTKVPRNP